VSGCDGAAGVRTERQDGWLRRVSSRVANRVGGWIVGDAVTDAGCGLKALRTRSLRRLPMFRGAHRFFPTLLRMQGAMVIEVPVGHRRRPWGTSRYGHGLSRTWVALRDALGVRWLWKRRIFGEGRPLEIDSEARSDDPAGDGQRSGR
jgi:dolichol-phosphate mannosyltransferase